MSLNEALEAHIRCITLHDPSFSDLDGVGPPHESVIA